MGCPHCNSPGKGVVRLGTEGYTRVKQGRCPYCGKRPNSSSGISIGFAGGSSSSEFLSDYEAEQALSKRRKLLIICLFLGVCYSIALGGKVGDWKITLGGGIAGGIGFIIALYFALLCCLNTKPGSHANYTKEHFPPIGFPIIYCLVCILMILQLLGIFSPNG